MTTESAGLSIEEAAANLLAIEDSYEEPTDEATEDEPVESEEVAEEIEESEEETADDDADEDESDSTPEDESTEPDPRLVEREKQLTADYTRKTQKLAEERKAFEAEAATVRATRDQYAEGLKNLEAALAKMAPPEPDWDRLRKEDPAEFAASWAEHQRLKEATSQVAAEREKIEREQREESEKQFADFLEGQRTKLLEAIPEWQDNEKASAEKGALMEYARGLGYTDEELGQVYDHRLLLVLRDAKRYRDLTTKSAALVADKKVVTKVLQPGSPPAPKAKGKQAEISKLRQELARSGSPKAAARLFELLEE